MNIYSQAIGQTLRYGLTILAAYLAVVGITENQQHELVETTINVLVPIIVAGIAQVWSFVNKRKLFETDPNVRPADPDA